ncbi:MAG: hypothetical protein WC505_02515 [Patescibacteria group bacterium]
MPPRHSFAYLAPRFLGTLLVLLIAAFFLETAADEFSASMFLITSVPTFIILLSLITAWKSERIGGILFIIVGIIGILYPFATVDEFHWGLLILPGWSAFVGILFILSRSKA